jgi:hypothetical protein
LASLALHLTSFRLILVAVAVTPLQLEPRSLRLASGFNCVLAPLRTDERGSDGKMLNILTDPNVIAVHYATEGWDVDSLLLHICRSTQPRYNALIDTGALITGKSNKEVAAFLFANGLGSWCDGVVFLDEHDEKMILVKASGRVVKLSQCGIAVEKRFAFYDQVWTLDSNRALRFSACHLEPLPTPCGRSTRLGWTSSTV